MSNRFGLFLCFFLTLICAASAVAQEGEGAEKPKKPPPKPTRDSAISSVLKLQEVKEWQSWMETQGYTLEIWGSTIELLGGEDGQTIYGADKKSSAENQEKEDESHTCWGVAVAENNKKSVREWAHFCVAQFGPDIWIEGTDTDNEAIYYPYEKWKKICNPTYNSPGTCGRPQ